jgi:hypothetical protein
MAMNAFVRLRQIVEQHKDIASRMEKLEPGHGRRTLTSFPAR